jgi:hypothetical protein
MERAVDRDLDQQRTIAITEYMQVEKCDESYLTPGRYRTAYLFNGYWLPLRKLKYHTSWEWLMPVIEKISKTPLLEADGTPCKDPQDVCNPITFAMPTADGKRVMFRFKGCACHEGDTLIDAAFEAVCEFIEMENYRRDNP